MNHDVDHGCSAFSRRVLGSTALARVIPKGLSSFGIVQIRSSFVRVWYVETERIPSTAYTDYSPLKYESYQ